ADSTRIKSLLTNVAPLVDRLAPDNATVVEYQYRRLQLAQKSNDPDAIKTAGEWIVRNGGGTPYELPALVVMAREADKILDTSSASGRAARIVDAAQLYSRLVALLGDSPATLSSNKNAFAASLKLAQYDEELQRWPQAADRLNRLLEAQPRDRRLLRRAGLACYHADRYAAALDHW